MKGCEGGPYAQGAPVLTDGPLEGIPEPGAGHRRSDARIIVSIPASLRTNSGCISCSVLVHLDSLGSLPVNSAMYETTFYARGFVNGV